MSEHIERGFWRDCFSDGSFMARAYGKSLRDNLVGLATPADAERIGNRIEAELERDRPSLSIFFQLEMELAQLASDENVKKRYWMVDDRFQRVVPLATRNRRAQSLPPPTDASWEDADFLRHHTLASLDAIHSNILLNVAREQSVKRLKLWLILLLAIAGIITLGWVHAPGHDFALFSLFSAGVFGAVLSISQRLQKAIDHDVMTMDGVFEVIGLRMGWVGILLSVISGGVFALVLYAVVMTGMLNLLTPSIVAVPSSSSAGASPNQTQVAPPTSVADVTGRTTTVTSPTPTPAPPPTSPPAQSPIPNTGPTATKDGEGLRAAREPKVAACEEARTSCVGKKHAQVLGLATGKDYFLMLLLAFLAGFAERLVPDVLSRLGKNMGTDPAAQK